MSLKITKIREVKTPTRAHETDAGIDFYIPEFNQSFIEDLESKNQNSDFYLIKEDKTIKLWPYERLLIPSGIKVNVPKNHALIAFNKSGVSSKLGLDLLASVVDCGYQGEVHISINNTSNETIYLSENQKIIQFILIPICSDNIEEVSENELFINESKRGSNGFGSTENK